MQTGSPLGADWLPEFSTASPVWWRASIESTSSDPSDRSNAEPIWAGGDSGVPFPGNPYYDNLLSWWLVNETLPLVLRARDVSAGSITSVVPLD